MSAFPSGIRTVIFDLDGTLIDSISDILAAVNRVLAECGHSPIEESARLSLVGEGGRIRMMKAFAMRHVELTDSELDLKTEEFSRYYAQDPLRHTRPFDGVRETISALHDKGIRLAVCTNKNEQAARDILKALRLMPPIEDVAGPDTFGVQKPHPDHIVRLLERMGEQPTASLFVGDSVHDIEAAHAAGIAVAAAAWGYSSTPVQTLGADLVLNRIDELATLIMPAG